MKCLFITLTFTLFTIAGFCQKTLISYDDIKYLVHNNLNKADTFLEAKGYMITNKDNNSKNRKYAVTLPGGTHNDISIRLDGKRLFIEIETNEIGQYNLIHESVVQYINKEAVAADIQSYTIKDLGNIYISINDTVPYNPIRKDYDIHIIPDKHITAYN